MRNRWARFLPLSSPLPTRVAELVICSREGLSVTFAEQAPSKGQANPQVERCSSADHRDSLASTATIVEACYSLPVLLATSSRLLHSQEEDMAFAMATYSKPTILLIGTCSQDITK